VPYTKHTHLIDANAWGYECQQGVVLRAGKLQTQAAFGMLKRLREVRMRWPHATQLVLWDGRAQWRYDLDPDYKSNRTSTPERIAMKEAYAEIKPYIEKMLATLGVRQITAYKHEADDLGGHFVRKLSADPTHHITLFTGDQDWLQLIRANVAWRDLRDDSRYVHAGNFYEFTGCRTPMEFLERKCLIGDTSDCISPAGGFGKDKGAPELIATWGSVRKFWQACDAGTYKPKTKAEKRLWQGESEFSKEQWAEGYQGDLADAKAFQKYMDTWPGQARMLFRRNFQLMQLLKVTPPLPQDLKVNVGKFDPDAFKSVCEELSFLSVTRNLDTFIQPFKPRGT
jgi:5'-3' exonuclease